MHAWVRGFILPVALLVAPASAAPAQETTGTIFGTLIDQTGGVLPAVKVIIKRVDTGQSRELITNGAGEYTAILPIGNYEITFLLPGFQEFIARGISLHVNDRLRVNGKLEVGGAVETLTVTAERLIQPTATVQYLMPRTAVRELPLLNRNFVQLATLVPGVSSDLREEVCFCAPQALGSTLSIAINGGRRSAVNWLLDGASNVNVFTNYELLAAPSLEAIEEINVLTSSYTAEWSRNGGGVVNVITKSGTRRFAGSFYEFLRHDGLNANTFFRNLSTDPAVSGRPRRVRYNNFGYTVGGPALADRRNLFFFVSQEWRRTSREKYWAGATVPDPAWLTDPASPDYVPPEERDPNAVKLLSLWPAANVAGANQYLQEITTAYDTRQEFVRGDYRPGGTWSITGRYFRDRAAVDGGHFTVPDVEPTRDRALAHVAVIEFGRVGTRYTNQLSYQRSRRGYSRANTVHTGSSLGLTVSEIYPENITNLVPSVSITGLTPLTNAGPTQPSPFNHTLSETVSVARGQHGFKAGGLIAFEEVQANLLPEATQGSFRFGSGGGFTSFQNFLRGNADGACGSGCTYFEHRSDLANRFRFRRYEAFIQDTWRAHARFTVDIGIRYSFYPPLTEASNVLANFSPAAYDPAQAPAFSNERGTRLLGGTGNLFNGFYIAGRNSPYGRAVYPADKNNVQPRLGLAWDPLGESRLILRAGYGVYFDQNQVRVMTEQAQAAFRTPFTAYISISNPALSNPGRGTVSERFPDGPGPLVAPDVYAISENFKAPRWQQWNAGLQRRLYRRGVVDVGYVGSRGDHLLREADINKPSPADILAAGGAENLVRPYRGLGKIIMRESTAFSRYHGLVARFRHDGGVTGSATVNYTFSRNRTDATDDPLPNGFLDDTQQAPQHTRVEFANAQTDRTHILTAYYVYEFPFGRKAGGWLKRLLAGWQVSGITVFESGPAVRLTVSRFSQGSSVITRPDQVGYPGAGNQSGPYWFDPAAFQAPPTGEDGDAPVSPFRLPGRQQWDFSVAKNLTFGSRRVQVRADLINAFNHTQFRDVTTHCFQTTTTCSSFGKIQSARPPREIQLGVRFDW